MAADFGSRCGNREVITSLLSDCGRFLQWLGLRKAPQRRLVRDGSLVWRYSILAAFIKPIRSVHILLVNWNAFVQSSDLEWLREKRLALLFHDRCRVS